MRGLVRRPPSQHDSERERKWSSRRSQAALRSCEYVSGAGWGKWRGGMCCGERSAKEAPA